MVIRHCLTIIFIARSLKILAYGCAFLDLLFALKPASISQFIQGVSATSQPLINSPKTKIDDPMLKSELLKVGHARHSISMKIPIAAFVLVLSVATLVIFLFYVETERLLTQQTSNEVAIESNLVEPMIEQLYRPVNSDILFLSRTPGVQGILESFESNDKYNYRLWKNELSKSN